MCSVVLQIGSVEESEKRTCSFFCDWCAAQLIKRESLFTTFILPIFSAIQSTAPSIHWVLFQKILNASDSCSVFSAASFDFLSWPHFLPNKSTQQNRREPHRVLLSNTIKRKKSCERKPHKKIFISQHESILFLLESLSFFPLLLVLFYTFINQVISIVCSFY